MKIPFEDGSFILIDNSKHPGKLLAITLCGVSGDGNSVIMSSSNLKLEQVVKIQQFLKEVIESEGI